MESEITDEKDHFHEDVSFHGALTVDQSDPSTFGESSTLRHRFFSHRGSSPNELGDSLIETDSKTSSKTYKFHRDLNPNDDIPEITDSTTHVEQTVTTEKNDELVTQGRNSADSGTELNDSLYSSLTLLMFISRLTMESIGFLLKLIIRSITLPITALSYLIILVIDPFRPLRQITSYVVSKLIELWVNSPCGRLVLGFGWGILWAAYLAFVLCGCVFTSLVISGILMRYLVERPFVVKETLNFEYTKNSPVAFVPIVSCAAVEKKKKIDVGMNLGSRIIPPFHELQVTVSLTLPESDYNRNLGMFQARTDFLSVNGETLASSSYPCMMRFRSVPIRLLLTLFKAAPVVAGFVSEIQTLNVKIRGLNKGPVPTACLKVVLEQQAAHGQGAGIPELYGASLTLESKLPFIKRIIWYWKKTVFIWVSIASFATELLFISVCCRSILLPRMRKTDGYAGRHR
ncbi:seipin-2-like [Hibiscus syriacus]|uniref:seipin-2-like n=1 Tax=Hibiscus syriacus TaxID=106335 RepID=UPI001923E744|nr:seipin-2-like [Hibiscus syriacus]